MPDITMKELVLRALPWLSDELNCTVCGEDYNPGSFGDAQVTFDCRPFRLRFLRERSLIFAEIASHAAPEEWIDVTVLFDALLDNPSVNTSEAAPKSELEALTWLGSLLKECLPKLTEALSPGLHETRATIERYAERRQESVQKLATRPLSQHDRFDGMRATPLGRVLIRDFWWIAAIFVLWRMVSR
jgi:hypothetical protein